MTEVSVVPQRVLFCYNPCWQTALPSCKTCQSHDAWHLYNITGVAAHSQMDERKWVKPTDNSWPSVGRKKARVRESSDTYLQSMPGQNIWKNPTMSPFIVLKSYCWRNGKNKKSSLSYQYMLLRIQNSLCSKRSVLLFMLLVVWKHSNNSNMIELRILYATVTILV